jgi:hypothetical protein
MKVQFALLALALTLPNFAHANNPVKGCAFGENTSALNEMLDKAGRGKIFYKGEQLSFPNMQRLQGITHTEREMILLAQENTTPGNLSDEKKLEYFVTSEGYITYFQHNDGREFAMVGSFPGDNEFGLVLEIKSLKRKSEYKILSIAALISDGDLTDCTVEKE